MSTRIRTYGHPTRVFAGVVAAALFVGCGGAAVPSEKLTNTQASIRAAEEVGAQTNPQAALHLKMARDEIAKARQLIKDGDNEEASLVLNQAQADADLALSYTHETAAKREAAAAQAKIAELQRAAQTQ